VTEPYQLPAATVLAARLSDDVAAVTIEVSRQDYLSYPIAPADLRRSNPHELVFPFHQLVDRQGSRVVFETYGPELPLPAMGSVHTFCWELLTYPDDGDHDHCLLTWKTISADTGDRVGYHSAHGWVTGDAYREFIEQDALRVRSCWRSIESPA
jgi:hypothetical protein